MVGDALHRYITNNPSDWGAYLEYADYLHNAGAAAAAMLIRVTYAVLHGHWGDASFQAYITDMLAQHIRFPACVRYVGVPPLSLYVQAIPPGSFVMGDRAGREVSVTLTRGFWLGICPVTAGQWRFVVGDTQSDDSDPAHPVQVSYGAAAQFCERLTMMARNAGWLLDCERYALPTEAQWEYACRAGTSSTYCFGDDSARLRDYAWFGSGVSSRDFPTVTRKLSNSWRLWDMHGLVWEWCRDAWEPRTLGGVDPYIPARQQETSSYVVRGGSWLSEPALCSSASRGYGRIDLRATAGFRVVLERGC